MPVFAVLLLLIPLIEIWLLIEIGGALGAFPTFLLLIASTVLGITLLRRLGFSTLMRAQRNINAGEMPAQALLEGSFIALGGILFLIPGFFTDALGLLLVLPPTRYLLLKFVLKRGLVMRGGFQQTTTTRSTQHPRDIEGEVVSRHEHAEKISSYRP